MAKGFIVGLIKIKDRAKFIEEFARNIGPMIEKNDGKFLSRTPQAHALEGRAHDLHVIVEFGDFQKALSLMSSREWNDLQDKRRAHSNVLEGSFMLLEEGDALGANFKN